MTSTALAALFVASFACAILYLWASAEQLDLPAGAYVFVGVVVGLLAAALMTKGADFDDSD